MNIVKIGSAALGALFLAVACQKKELPPMQLVEKPDWAEKVTINEVMVQHTDLEDHRGVYHIVPLKESKTLSDGLVASRTYFKLMIRDPQGIECRWKNGGDFLYCLSNPDIHPG